MNAVEVLAKSLEVRYGTTTTWAQHIIDDLKEAGYSVVEMPEPGSAKTDWGEFAFILMCLLPAPLMVLWMVWRVIFG